VVATESAAKATFDTNSFCEKKADRDASLSEPDSVNSNAFRVNGWTNTVTGLRVEVSFVAAFHEKTVSSMIYDTP